MRWGRAIAGGFIAEALLMVAVLPGAALGSESIVLWTAVIGSGITTCLAALWVARRLDSGFVLHGAVVGLTAMLVYVALLAAMGQAQAQPAIYWVAHGLKILGGVAGGLVAARRMATASGVARASV